MLTPEKVLRPRCGDTIVFQLDIARDGKPMPLEGVRLAFFVKRSADDPDSAAVLRKRSDEGITHTPVAGRALVMISPSESRALGFAESYVWDVQGIDAGGNVFTPDGLAGRLRQLADVTKAAS